MLRLCFFVYPGSGTESLINLFGGSLTQTLYTEEDAGFYGVGHPENLFILMANEPLLREDITATVIYIGDWWGPVPLNCIPGPYEGEADTRWDKDSLQHLPGCFGYRRFICVMFDGREYIEQQKRLDENWSSDKFQTECCKWRNKARVALDCAAHLGNYHLVVKEQICKHPVATVSDLLMGADLTPSLVDLQSAAESLDMRLPKYPSWISWTPEEVSCFEQIAGKELAELGYNWEIALSYPPPEDKIDIELVF